MASWRFLIVDGNACSQALTCFCRDTLVVSTYHASQLTREKENDPDNRYNNIGFRCARDMELEQPWDVGIGYVVVAFVQSIHIIEVVVT